MQNIEENHTLQKIAVFLKKFLFFTKLREFFT
jgi:hypothetical protein